MQQIFIAQKRCIRAVAGKRYCMAPDAPRFMYSTIQGIYSLYILESGKFVKKYADKFTKNSDHPDTRIHVTRNATYNENNLFVARFRNINFVQNPLIMLARVWNHLPENIKAIENLILFTKKLKILLLKQMF
jgi:hypothetical protein